MRTGRGVIGVIGIDRDAPGPLFSPDQHRLLDALLDQAALAVERVHLMADIERARRTAETDRLRQALLTSISHDLKTPLAAILGAAGALRDLWEALDGKAKSELLATIIEESERLNRFIANLLDMTRLEAGAVVPHLALHDPGEVVGAAVARAGKVLAGHRVEVDLAPDLPMLRLDPILLEQALFNVLDNAAKYAGPGTTIRIRGGLEGRRVSIQVLDEGEGIAPGDLAHVFDKFYRARKADRVRAGTGLGLAIARGFIEAMGGTIEAANRGDRPGAAFSVHLPVPEGERRLESAA
jgi:two-component system sensor histidine kinase KdpD